MNQADWKTYQLDSSRLDALGVGLGRAPGALLRGVVKALLGRC